MASAVAGPEIERLIQLLARLPGLGPRSARRAALHLIKKREVLMEPLTAALETAMDKIVVEGAAGGGLVTVTLTGKGDLKGVKLDDSLIKPGEKEILEDLLVAAHADAKRKSEAVLQDKMKALTGGLPLPPGMKLF